MNRPDKRQQIMQAAEGLFTSRRFHEITLDEVAQAAQVGKGTIYLYFQDKDDLFFSVATSGFDELCDLLQQGVPGEKPFREQLTSACREISAFFRRRRPLMRMMQAEEGRLPWLRGAVRDKWLAHRKRLRTAVGAIMARGVAEGAIRADVPPETLAAFLLGMLRTCVHDLSDTSDGADGRTRELVLDLFCRGAGRSN
jgi:AcrR family transcriptional regulator